MDDGQSLYSVSLFSYSGTQKTQVHTEKTVTCDLFLYVRSFNVHLGL